MKKRGHGEGTIYREQDGRWHGQLRLPNGKRKNVYGKTQKEVLHQLTQLRREVDAGLHGTLSGEQILSSFVDEWITSHKHQLRPKTVKNYTSIMRLVA